MNARLPLAVMASVSVLGGMMIVARAPAEVVISADMEVEPAAGQPMIASLRRGMSVHLSGEVIRVVDRDEFRMSDGTGSIPVRMSWTGPSPVTVGDAVRVEGVIVDEKTFGLSRPELIARSLRLPSGAVVQFETPKPVQIAPPPEAGSTQTIPIGSLSRGQSGEISGRVTGILDVDEFRLEDASGSVRVYVGWQNRVGVRVGDLVTISGTLDDEPWPIPAEFYADAVTLADGRVVDLRGGTSGGRAGDPAAPASTTTIPTSSATTGATPTQPSRIADIRPYDMVLLRGTVERITDEDEFRLRDDSASIGIYIGWRNAMPVVVGDQVSVIGIVDAEGAAGLLREVYAHEIVTADGRRVELQPRRDAARPQVVSGQPAERNVGAVESGTKASPSQDVDTAAVITPIGDVRRGQAVTLRGTVQRLRDTDEFVLRDDTGSITIYIGWRNRMPVSQGQSVTVVGTADDDVLPGFRPEIYASRIVLPDGRAVELTRGGRDE